MALLYHFILFLLVAVSICRGQDVSVSKVPLYLSNTTLDPNGSSNNTRVSPATHESRTVHAHTCGCRQPAPPAMSTTLPLSGVLYTGFMGSLSLSSRPVSAPQRVEVLDLSPTVMATARALPYSLFGLQLSHRK